MPPRRRRCWPKRGRRGAATTAPRHRPSCNSAGLPRRSAPTWRRSSTELGARNVAVFSGHLFRGEEMDEAAQEDDRGRDQAARRSLVQGAACRRRLWRARRRHRHHSRRDRAQARRRARHRAPLRHRALHRDLGQDRRSTADPPANGRSASAPFSTGAKALARSPSWIPTEPADRDLDGYFFHAFRYAAGCALQRAAMLQTRCRLVVVSDDGGPDTIAGTNRAVADWREHGRPLDLIPFPHARRQRATKQTARTPSALSCFCGTRRRTARTPRPCWINLPSWPAKRSSASTARIATGGWEPA